MSVASSSGLSPWIECPAPSTRSITASAATHEFILVGVVDDRAICHSPHQHDGHSGGFDRVPQRRDVQRFFGRVLEQLGAPVSGVAPHPTAIGSLLGVMQNASPQRRLRASGIELHRAGQKLLEARKVLRAIDERVNRLGLLRGNSRRDIDEGQLGHDFGSERGDGRSGEASERHAHHRLCRRSQRPNGSHHIFGVAHEVPSPLCGAIGVSVAGQIDSHQRPADGHGKRVPGMGVLSTAMEQHQLWCFGAPDQRTQRSSISERNRFAPNRRRTVIGKSVIFGVARKHRKLVVVDELDASRGLGHRAPRTNRPGRAPVSTPASRVTSPATMV